MKYFTHEWHTGVLSDEEFDDALESYRRHIATIAPLLPDPLRYLATTLSLHDGLIEQVVVQPASSVLSLALRTGDLQRGYSTSELTYIGVPEPASHSSMFRTLVVAKAGLVSDELDVFSSGFVHRLYFCTGDEIELTFREFGLRETPRKNRLISIPIDERVQSRAGRAV